jgi:hypothetical protein
MTPVPFVPRHVAHSGSIVLRGAADVVFPLFGPDGERRWVPGWEPEYLHPRSGQARAGMVFRTQAHGEETLWLVLAFEPAARVAAYARVTPGSRMGTVRVAAEALEGGSTRVTVSYDLTALSEAGNETLAAFTAKAYAGMLEEWREAIGRVLADP